MVICYTMLQIGNHLKVYWWCVLVSFVNWPQIKVRWCQVWRARRSGPVKLLPNDLFPKVERWKSSCCGVAPSWLLIMIEVRLNLHMYSTHIYGPSETFLTSGRIHIKALFNIMKVSVYENMPFWQCVYVRHSQDEFCWLLCYNGDLKLFHEFKIVPHQA